MALTLEIAQIALTKAAMLEGEIQQNEINSKAGRSLR